MADGNTHQLTSLSGAGVDAAADEFPIWDNSATVTKRITVAQALIGLGAIAKTLADANSVLYAVNDNTPAALAMGASTILARLAAGNIVAATPDEITTLLALAAADISDFDTQVATTAVLKSLFDANTILAANTDNTPAALTVAEQRLVGRLTGGNIDDLTAAQVRKFIGNDIVTLLVTSPTGDDLATGDGQVIYRVPDALNGMNLVAVSAWVSTVSTAGGPILVQVRNVTQTADMLTTRISIDDNETDSSTATAAAAIDAGNDDVATADQIAIDVDDAGTGAKGLGVELQFAAP